MISEFVVVKAINFNEARKKIKEKKGKRIIFSSENDELNRKVMEKEDIEMILLHQKTRKDFSKQRNSGLNQVMVKIAKKKRITIGINFDEIIEAKNKEKSQILSRIIQNIKLCNKYNTHMLFFYQKHPIKNNDAKALASVLGMPTWMTKNF